MNTVYFKFNERPGDLFRSTNVTELPNPQKDLESFLIQFLPCYQTDDQVTYLDDLHKLLYDEFSEEERKKFIDFIGSEKTKEEIILEIKKTEKELIDTAYQNFYSLILNQKIIIYSNGKK